MIHNASTIISWLALIHLYMHFLSLTLNICFIGKSLKHYIRLSHVFMVIIQGSCILVSALSQLREHSLVTTRRGGVISRLRTTQNLGYNLL